MAQLPASMRRKRAAVTSIHDKLPTRKEKLANAGGWLLLLVAVMVLAVGLFGLYRVMTDAQIGTFDVVGTRSDAERRQVSTHVAPTVTANYFTSDLIFICV